MQSLIRQEFARAIDAERLRARQPSVGTRGDAPRHGAWRCIVRAGLRPCTIQSARTTGRVEFDAPCCE